MRLITCYICKQKFTRLPNNHIYGCAKRHNVKDSRKNIRVNQLEFQFNLSYQIVKQLLDQGYVGTDFIREYGLCSRSFYVLYNYYGLKRSKEATLAIKNEKYKTTCLNKYGVESSNSLTSIQTKKKKTLMSRYGVDNSAKIEGSSAKAQQTTRDKNGGVIPSPYVNKTEKEMRNIMAKAWKGSKNRWANMSGKEKADWIILLHKARREWWNSLSDDEKVERTEARSMAMYRSNKLELKIELVLKQLRLKFTRQKWVNKRSYDFYLDNYGILIEVQGNYWHGNPSMYKSTDIIKFPKRNPIKVTDLWKKDAEKKKNAEIYGYSVVYLWEDKINSMSNKKLKETIRNFYK